MAGILDRIQDLFDRDDSRRITSPMAGRSRTVYNVQPNKSFSQKFWTGAPGNALASIQRKITGPSDFIPTFNQDQMRTDYRGTGSFVPPAFRIGYNAAAGTANAVTKELARMAYDAGNARSPQFHPVSATGRAIDQGIQYGTGAIKPFDTVGSYGPGTVQIPFTNTRLPEFGISESNAMRTAKIGGELLRGPTTLLGLRNPKAIVGYTGIGGGLNSLMALPESFRTNNPTSFIDAFMGGAGETVIKAPTMVGIGSKTNPLIDKIGGRAVTRIPMKSGANVLEGLVMDKIADMETTPESIAIDALFPVALEGFGPALKQIQKGYKAIDNSPIVNWRARNIMENNGWIVEDPTAHGRFQVSQDAPEPVKEVIGTRFMNRAQMRWALKRIEDLYGKNPNFAGLALGIEPYQNEDGTWSVRYNSRKGLAGIAVSMGMKKVGGDDFNKLLGDQKIPDLPNDVRIKSDYDLDVTKSFMDIKKDIKESGSNIHPTFLLDDGNMVRMKGENHYYLADEGFLDEFPSALRTTIVEKGKNKYELNVDFDAKIPPTESQLMQVEDISNGTKIYYTIGQKDVDDIPIFDEFGNISQLRKFISNYYKRDFTGQKPETPGIKYNPDGTVSKTAENFEAKRMKLAEEISRIAKTFAKESGLTDKPDDYFFKTREALNNRIMSYNLNADKLGIPRMKEIRVSDQINDIAKQNYPNQSKTVARQMQQPNEIKKDIAKFTDQFKGKPMSLERATEILQTSRGTVKDVLDFVEEARRGKLDIIGGTPEQRGEAIRRIYNMYISASANLQADGQRVKRLGYDSDAIKIAIENKDTSDPIIESLVKGAKSVLDSLTSAEDMGIKRENYVPYVRQEDVYTQFMDLQYGKSLLGNIMYKPLEARTGKDWLGTADVMDSINYRVLAEIEMAVSKLAGVSFDSEKNIVDQIQDVQKSNPDFNINDMPKFEGTVGIFKSLSNKISGLDKLFTSYTMNLEGAELKWQDLGLWHIARDMYLNRPKKIMFDYDFQTRLDNVSKQNELVPMINELADISGLEAGSKARNDFIGNAMTNLNRAESLTTRKNIVRAMGRKASRYAFIDRALMPIEKFISTHDIVDRKTKDFIDQELRSAGTYYKELTTFEDALQKARRTMQLGLIGGNISTYAKQPFESFRALGEYDIKNFSKAMGDAYAGKKSQFDWMINQDLQYKYLSGGERIAKDKYNKVLNAMEKVGFKGMQMAELPKNRVFIRGAELDGIEKGLSGKQLENYVFDSFIKSAHSYDMANVPTMMKGELAKFLLMFQTYGMKQGSYFLRTLDDLAMGIAAKDTSMSVKQVKKIMSVALGAYVQMWVFNKLFKEPMNKAYAIQTALGGIPEMMNPLLSAAGAQIDYMLAPEDDDYRRDIAISERNKNLLNSIPFANQLYNKTYKGFKYITQGYVDSKSGKSVRYVGPEKTSDKLRVLVFGPKASDEANAFYEGGARAYGKIQTERIRQASKARGAGGTLAVAQDIADTKALEEANTKAKAYVLNNHGTMETEDKIWYYEDGDAHSINKIFEIDKPELTGVKEIDDKITKDYNTRLGKVQSNIAKLVEIGEMSTDEARERIVEINKLQLLTKPVPKRPTLTGNQFIDTEILTDYNGELTTYLNDSMEMYEAGMLSQEQFATRIKGIQAMKDLISDLKKSFKGPSTKTSKRSTKIPKIPSSQRPPAMKQYSQSSVPVFTPPPLATKIDFSKYVKDVKQPQRTQFRKLQRI